MMTELLRKRNFGREFVFATSRSRGPGGQNINKVNTKVELRFNVLKSAKLSDSEKRLINEKLNSRINLDGELIIISQAERSQLKNKKKTIEKFYDLLSKVLIIKSPRIPIEPSAKSESERLETKRKRANIKKLRKDTGASEDIFKQ